MIESRQEMCRIIEKARTDGWVLEPEAKRLFGLAGFDIPRFRFVRTLEEAIHAAGDIGYPVVIKVVSPRVLHKSDVKGVAVGITDDTGLAEVFSRLRTLDGFLGVIVEERIAGIELILGAKIDLQFGPMVLLGMGGTGVEIYNDVALKMAPLSEEDAAAMIGSLKARPLLTGYRGNEGVDVKTLSGILVSFASVVMELEQEIESIDINPLLCSLRRCVVADARIILKSMNAAKTLHPSN